MNHLDWETTDEKFLAAWQGLIRQSVYEQRCELVAYAESLEDPLVRLNRDRDAAIARVTQIQRRYQEELAARRAEQGDKHERTFDNIEDALGFAALVNGVAYFWTADPGFKVVWYTSKKEVS